MKYEINFGVDCGQTIIISRDATHHDMHCQVVVQFCDMVWYIPDAVLTDKEFSGNSFILCSMGEGRVETISKPMKLTESLENCGYTLAAEQVRKLAHNLVKYKEFCCE